MTPLQEAEIECMLVLASDILVVVLACDNGLDIFCRPLTSSLGAE